MLRTLALAAAIVLTPLSILADDFEAQRRAIEEIRGLKFIRPVETTAITRTQFREELQMRLGEALPVPLDDYFRALEALQLIPRHEGVIKQLLDLYEQQVLAFYDPIRHRYYSISDGLPGASLTAELDEAVVIHELTHALQDQTFDAGRKLQELQIDTDGQLAYQAVLEGEATLVMLAFVYRSLGKSLDELINDQSTLQMLNAGAAAIEVESQAPAYFVDSLKFPYVEGFRIVLAAYKSGGWEEVSRLHGKRMPTTEAVMHPGLFLKGKVSVPRFRVKSSTQRCCRTLLATRLGEFHWRFLLGAPAAEGWADDFVSVHADGEGGTTVLVETQWDRPRDASEFVQAYERFLAARKLPFRVRLDGTRVRVAYGKSPELIEAFIGRRKR